MVEKEVLFDFLLLACEHKDEPNALSNMLRM